MRIWAWPPPELLLKPTLAPLFVGIVREEAPSFLVELSDEVQFRLKAEVLGVHYCY